MDLKNIESFICVAEMNSFTKAADKLGYSQSTMSFQIKQLEKQLDTTLFERVNHTIKLTNHGQEILSLAHQIMQLSSAMEKVSDISRPLSGHLRIAMAESLCQHLFRDNFQAFHEKYPNISLKVLTTSTEEMFRLLKQNEADLVYTLDKHIYHPNYMIASEKKVGMHFVAASDHPLCQKPAIPLTDIIAHPMILTEKGMSYRKLLEEDLASRSLAVDPYLEIGDPSLICRLISQNLGLSFLPDFVTEHFVQNGLLRRLNVPGFSIDIWIQLLYHREKWCSPEMNCVIQYLQH